MQTTYPAGASQSWGWSYGWPLALAPNLEQTTMFNAFNFSAGMFGNANGYTIQHGNDTLLYMQLSVLICPSDGNRQRPQAPIGATNYVGNVGGPGQIGLYTGTIVSNPVWGGVPDQANCGIIGIENIRDGTSNTALFSERLIGLNNVNPTTFFRSNIDFKRVVFDGPSVGGGPDSGPTAALTFIKACQNLPGTTPAHNSGGNSGTWGSGAYWLAGYPLHIVINGYLHAGTPNGPACNNYQGSFSSSSWIYFVNPQGSAPPTSNHPGGVNMALADGSVKFVKDSVGYQPWWSLGTRSNGDVLSADQY
jgi:prepilin-type processing-associated H-X9-DG protein